MSQARKHNPDLTLLLETSRMVGLQAPHEFRLDNPFRLRSGTEPEQPKETADA